MPPLPLNADQVDALVSLLKDPPAGEEEALVDLLTDRVPPGVDEAAYVKAGFLAAVAKEESPDVGLCGVMADDGNFASVPPMLAELIDVPSATSVLATEAMVAELPKKEEAGGHGHGHGAPGMDF